MLKKLLIVSSISLGVLAGANSAQALDERKFIAATPIVILMPHVLPNAEFLELKPEQLNRLRLVASDMSGEREEVDMTILELRKELAEITAEYDLDKEAQHKAKLELFQLEQRRVEMSIECSNILREILTEKQWEQMLELALDMH